MKPNQKPCPLCGEPMHRQSKKCLDCWKLKQATEEHRAMLSQKKMGQPTYIRTPEYKALMSSRTTGKKRPGFRPASTRPEVAKKIRAWWTPERREAARERGERQAADPEWRLRCGQPGELNPMWEDGRAVIPYARGWTPAMKRQAWERAGNRCEICQSDKACDTHHKDFRKDNHSLENLQVLCRKCHKRLHVDHLRQQP